MASHALSLRRKGLPPQAVAALLLAAPIVVGAGLALVFSEQSSIGGWLRGFFRVGGRRVRPRQQAMASLSRRFQAGDRPIDALRAAIVGSARGTVASALGPPHSASLAARPDVDASFWDADTWYYPLHREAHVALAIRFAGNLAERVDFISTPQAEPEE